MVNKRFWKLPERIHNEADAEISKVTKEKAATLYAQARDLYKRAKLKKGKPLPIILRLDFDEAIYINDHDISEIIFSKSMSDDDIASELKEIYIGDDPELQDIKAKITTINKDNERIIVIGFGDKNISQADVDEYLKFGISLDDIYVIEGKNENSGRTIEEKGHVKIIVPSDDKSSQIPGMLMKVILPDEN